MKTASFSPLGEGRCASVLALLAGRVNVDTWAVDCTSAWNTEQLCTPWLGRSQAVRETCEDMESVGEICAKTKEENMTKARLIV